MKSNTTKAEISDNIDDTVNYQMVYNLVKEEMQQPSHLFEHVARRILDKVTKQFPAIDMVFREGIEDEPGNGWKNELGKCYR